MYIVVVLLPVQAHIDLTRPFAGMSFFLDHQVNRNSRQLYTTGGIGVSSSECNNLLLLFVFCFRFFFDILF